MTQIGTWKYLVTVIVICIFIFVLGDSLRGSKEVAQYKELNKRQQDEFVDPLGYDKQDTLTYEQLYERQRQEFVNPLGYDEDGIYTAKDTEESNDKHKIPKSHKDFRRRRSASGSDLFSIIAGISGGSVISTDKDNISSALGVLTSVTLPSPMLISRWSIHVQSSWTGSVHVDSSVYNLAVEVQTSCCKPILDIFDPTGRKISVTDPNVTVTANTTTILHVRIGQPMTGVWVLNVSDTSNQKYDINARGSSPIDFDGSPVSINGTAVSGQPESGNNSTFMKIEPEGSDLVSNWTYLVVKATNGTILQRIPMGIPKGSRTLRWYIVKVVWPNKDVYVGVEGIDKDGHPFTREQLNMVLPSGIRLTLLNPDVEYINTCDRPTVLRYSTKNVGVPGNFTIKVLIDTTNFGAVVTPSSFHLDNLFSHTLNCTVTLKSILYDDTVANVNVQIIDSNGHTQYLQHNLFTKKIDCRSTTQTSRLSSFSVVSTPPSSASAPAFSVFLTIVVMLKSFV